MTPLSITIKLDFGAENAAGTKSTMSLEGNVPTPYTLSEFSSSASGNASAALPTPFGGTAQQSGQVNSAVPAPSPNLGSAGSMGAASNASMQGDAPTPFSLGSFPQDSTGDAAGAVPTPFDNPANLNIAGDQAPTPQTGAPGYADPAMPDAAQGNEPGDEER